MVEGIEHVGGDFETIFFVELRFLADAHVEAANTEAPHRPAPARSAVRREEDWTKVLKGGRWIREVVDARAGVTRAATRSVAGRANASGAADIFMHASPEGVGVHGGDGALGYAEDEPATQ